MDKCAMRCVKNQFKKRKMKTINLLLVALFIVSCGQNLAPDKKKNKSDQKVEKATPKVDEVKDEMPVLSSFWAELFKVDNELKFKQNTTEERRCDENGEVLLSEDENGEVIYPVDKSSMNIWVKVVKVEKNTNGIWVATMKSNDPSFPLKWYTDEKSLWHDEMVMHFPASPKTLSKNVNGQEVEIDFDQSTQTWTYSEYIGDAVYILSFHKVFGLKRVSLLYDGACDAKEITLKRK
jgi:hypothetical protein